MTTETINIINHLHLFAEADDTSAIMRFVFFLLMIAAVVGPYFLVPTLFRFVGGAFGRLAGLASKGEMSMFNRIKGKGQDARGQWSKGFQKKEQRKNLRASTTQRNARENLFDQLNEGRSATTATGRARQRMRSFGMSEDVLDATRMERSKENKARADYAAEVAGIDNKQMGELGFTVIDIDGNAYEGVSKDHALAMAGLGATVKNAYGDVAYDGSEAAQRSALDLAGKQGLAEVMNNVRGQSFALKHNQMDANGNVVLDGNGKPVTTTAKIMGIEGMKKDDDGNMKVDMTDSTNPDVQRIRSVSTNLTEAMNVNTSSLMPKLESYYKGQAKSFGNVSGASLATYDKTEVEQMFKWAGDPTAHKNEKGNVTADAHKRDIARVGAAVQEMAQNPEHYKAKPEVIAAVARGLDAIKVNGELPDGFSDEMKAAAARISTTGVIHPPPSSAPQQTPAQSTQSPQPQTQPTTPPMQSPPTQTPQQQNQGSAYGNTDPNNPSNQ